MLQIENFSNVEQHVWDDKDGKRYSIPANTIVMRSPDVAALFLTQRAKFVRKYVPSTIPDRPNEKKVWIANVTGNPRAKKTYTFSETDKKTGLTVNSERENPLATATTVVQRMIGGQEPGIDREGGETLINLPGVVIRIPPATRVQAPQTIANWLLTMDETQDDIHAHGRLVKCRAPSEFEPNESWDYDDIRIFAREMQTDIDLKKAFPPARSFKDGAVEKAKEDLLHALFFYLIDERYTLPPRQAIEAAKAAEKG